MHVFSIEGASTLLNGETFLARGLRCSNALISDETADDLVAHLDEYAGYGVNTVSVFLMGSRFGDVKGYREDASLSPDHAARLGRIIEGADQRGMVVIVGCLYWDDSRAKWNSWTQTEANAAVVNTMAFLAEHDYRNTFIDVDNEGMALRAKGFDNRELVLAAKRVDGRIPVATNYHGDPPDEADLAIHHSNRAPGKPYIESEGSPPNAPGGYWGEYSKREGLYGYLNVGVYTDEVKQAQIVAAAQHYDRGEGYLFASTWLQAPPPQGPNTDPGGDGSTAQPGVRWWLQWLKERFGAYQAVGSAAAVNQ
ncbi:MAG: hypothetical protein GF331_26220 [Chitinivibrionales bacterium]|nr:hypothetical protein [Chitinivibrionales bacterium]